MKRVLISIVAAAALAACGGGSDAQEAPSTGAQVPPTTSPIAALEAAGKLPTLDRSDSLKGADANANGVRDDIEAILTAKYQTPGQRAAAMQFARSYQAILDVPVGDRVAAKQVKLLGSRALVCLYSNFDSATSDSNPSVVGSRIEAMTFDTKLRMKAYMQFMDALNGSVWSLPEGNTCEQ